MAYDVDEFLPTSVPMAAIRETRHGVLFVLAPAGACLVLSTAEEMKPSFEVRLFVADGGLAGVARKTLSLARPGSDQLIEAQAA